MLRRKKKRKMMVVPVVEVQWISSASGRAVMSERSSNRKRVLPRKNEELLPKPREKRAKRAAKMRRHPNRCSCPLRQCKLRAFSNIHWLVVVTSRLSNRRMMRTMRRLICQAVEAAVRSTSFVNGRAVTKPKTSSKKREVPRESDVKIRVRSQRKEAEGLRNLSAC